MVSCQLCKNFCASWVQFIMLEASSFLANSNQFPQSCFCVSVKRVIMSCPCLAHSAISCGVPFAVVTFSAQPRADSTCASRTFCIVWFHVSTVFSHTAVEGDFPKPCMAFRESSHIFFCASVQLFNMSSDCLVHSIVSISISFVCVLSHFPIVKLVVPLSSYYI